MQFEYVLQRRDEAEAQTARFPGDRHPAGDPPKRPSPVTFITAVIVIVTVALLLQLGPAVATAASGYCPRLVTEIPGDPTLFAAGTVMATIGLLSCLIPTLLLLRARNSSRPVSPLPVTIFLADDGLTLRTTAKQFTLAWDGLVAVAETPALFVVKTVGDLRLPLPKRALPSPDAVAQLRTMLHARVAPLACAVPSDTNTAP
jgi:hypothetical protein